VVVLDDRRGGLDLSLVQPPQLMLRVASLPAVGVERLQLGLPYRREAACRVCPKVLRVVSTVAAATATQTLPGSG
jgi:hypothetical protein